MDNKKEGVWPFLSGLGGHLFLLENGLMIALVFDKPNTKILGNFFIFVLSTFILRFTRKRIVSLYFGRDITLPW